MSEKPEDPRDPMPSERRSMWRTAEERRMSDLTRVLEWLARRQGKKHQGLQKHKPKMATPFKARGKEEKKGKSVPKPQGGNRQVSFSDQATGQSTKKENSARYRRPYGAEPKGKRLSTVPGNYTRDSARKSDLDIKDAIALESTQRSMPYRRQSITEPTLPDTIFGQRRSTLLRDWVVKAPDSSYERKLKSLMEKGTEPKIEMVKMLKPEEVLSCRYLRLSKNNIRTLLKLCKDAGMNVDIHPHMVEGEIDAKMVFSQNRNVAL